AIRRAGSANPKAIRDALENTKNLKLLHAVITIDPNTHDPLNKDAVILPFACFIHQAPIWRSFLQLETF
ncbi:MAG: hypothetical protein N2445_07360, partial [Acidobacteria bacterium]|nr:hypothetical protein [Acidobacteriota bacterium]